MVDPVVNANKWPPTTCAASSVVPVGMVNQSNQPSSPGTNVDDLKHIRESDVDSSYATSATVSTTSIATVTSATVTATSTTTSTTSSSADKAKRRDKSKPKKVRRSDPRLALPNLTIQSIESDGDVIHCQLETSKQSMVSFKFSRDVDLPEDIAENLVS
ncbi:hypothetical protein HELRODRAFT_184579 [Helobdella robusta]|uniref:Serine/threonine-protein kinase WNK CCTL2 domain-containing protein n=1 Tax=Helobdella robusta TaxID=6412 RepID=T1FLI7_HELRO|nr:hypothetical protein HELRODRAFT_184579 [Helobdella robusta]ESO09648.1 hypothetical protein HELRODRAFT_184579 [Helobdella robusta]